jgi:hypothetical protein
VTESHDDRTPVEHDPTGMRALLASLPEPEPMPEDLVRRITAALAAEGDAGATASAVPPGPAVASTGATVVPLPRRRFGLRHLGVAAAVVGALGLGGVVLSNAPDGLTASIGAAGGSAESAEPAEDAGSAARDQASSGEDRRAGLVVPPAGSGEVVVVMSGRSYTAADLGAGARELTTDPGDTLRSLAAESPGIGPIGTPIGARSCAAALDVPGDAGLLVDVAEVDGRPAAVIVVDSGTGRTAYAVERFCTGGTTSLIHGPVPVG